MGLIRNLWRGYRGGPNFDSAQWHSFIIGDQLLQLYLPATPFYTQPQRKLYTEQQWRPERYSIDEKDWFASHQEQLYHHHFVQLTTEIWPFDRVIPLPMADKEVGQLIFQALLKQVPEQAKMDAFDLERLGQLEFLNREAHYWGEPPPDDAVNQMEWQGRNTKMQGRNTKIKRECEADVYRCRTDYPSLQAYIDDFVAKAGHPPIHPEVRAVAGRRFVFYIEGCGRYQTDRTYSLPLTSRYYLQLRFRHDVMSCSKRIQQAALAAEQRILTEMTLGPMVADRAPSDGELGSIGKIANG